MRTVIGLMGDVNEAMQTIRDLKKMGLRSDQISVISRDTSIGRDVQGVALEPVSVGGVGQVSAGGPMTHFLTPMTAQSSPDAFVSALMRMGVPREEASSYVDGVKRGYTLEAAIVDDEKADEALAIMREHSHEPSAPAAGLQGRSEARTEERGATIPVVEEELVVGKREVPAGGVRVSTHVIEQPVVEEISLREEHIDVERRAVERPIGETEDAFRDKTIEVVATAEEPVVEKHARVVEEVVVGKTAAERKEEVRDTVRKTEVEARKIPAFEASGFREHYEQLQTSGGERQGFETYEPAYRFGHELRHEPKYAGEDWTRIEPDVRRSWEKRSPGTWDRFRDAIRHAWERATE